MSKRENKEGRYQQQQILLLYIFLFFMYEEMLCNSVINIRNMITVDVESESFTGWLEIEKDL